MSLIGQAGPGKFGLISRAKGWESCFLLLPLPFELDRIERCLSSSKEARRRNPGCCTLPPYVEKQHRQSNPGVRSYGRLLVGVSHRESGRGGKTLLSPEQGRPWTKRVRGNISSNPVSGTVGLRVLREFL